MASSRTAATRPRRPEPVDVVLPALADVPAERLSRGDSRELERYADADLSGAELPGTSFLECLVERVTLHEVDLRGVHLVDCRWQQVDASALSVPRSSFRGVELAGSRIGAFEAYESTWRSVSAHDTRIGYLNARSSTWQDATFRDCSIDELDLTGATLTRVAFPGCRIGTLRAAGSTFTDVDLRDARLEVVEGLDGLAGAWVSEQQLTELAPLLAAHLHIRVG